MQPGPRISSGFLQKRFLIRRLSQATFPARSVTPDPNNDSSGLRAVGSGSGPVGCSPTTWRRSCGVAPKVARYATTSCCFQTSGAIVETTAPLCRSTPEAPIESLPRRAGFDPPFYRHRYLAPILCKSDFRFSSGDSGIQGQESSDSDSALGGA